MEPASRHLTAGQAHKYGYGLYSARYGNIYTTRQLLQLAQEATGAFHPQEAVWEKDGRYFDALRPSIEPTGLASAEEVRAHRRQHLTRVAALLREVDVLVFTLGLTETWEHLASGTVYPTAPGVIAGIFESAEFGFRNLTHAEVVSDFLAFRDIAKSLNPEIRFILTVSPVPLTATAGQEHVLPATIYSKSVLRAVAGELYQRFDDIDYFPSYEIIAGHQSRGFFYGANLRTVAEEGVDVVMKTFFSQHERKAVRSDEPTIKRRKRGALGPRRAPRRSSNVTIFTSSISRPRRLRANSSRKVVSAKAAFGCPKGFRKSDRPTNSRI